MNWKELYKDGVVAYCRYYPRIWIGLNLQLAFGLKITAFWVVTPCIRYRTFRRNGCVPLPGIKVSSPSTAGLCHIRSSLSGAYEDYCAPYSLVDIYQRFREYFCLQFQFFYPEDGGSRLLLISGKYEFTLRDVPEDSNLELTDVKTSNLTTLT
jgi:hypothetical protein